METVRLRFGAQVKSVSAVAEEGQTNSERPAAGVVAVAEEGQPTAGQVQA